MGAIQRNAAWRLFCSLLSAFRESGMLCYSKPVEVRQVMCGVVAPQKILLAYRDECLRHSGYGLFVGATHDDEQVVHVFDAEGDFVSIEVYSLNEGESYNGNWVIAND
jgi:hypothetical protein